AGLFINTIPTRVQLRSTDSFGHLLNRLNQEQCRLSAHHYLGLAEIQRLTGLNELFDTLVIFKNFPADTKSHPEHSGGLRLTDFEVQDSTHYPLTLTLALGEQLTIYFDYHPDHFNARTVELISRRFVRLLAAYASASDQPVSCINLFDEQERRQ